VTEPSYLGFANKKKLRNSTGTDQGIVFNDDEAEDQDHKRQVRFQEEDPVPAVEVKENYGHVPESHQKYSSWARTSYDDFDDEPEFRSRGKKKPEKNSRRHRNDRVSYDDDAYSDEDGYDEEEEDENPEERMRNLLVRWKSLLSDGVDVPQNFDGTSDEKTVREAVELGEAQLDEQSSVEFLQVCVVILFWVIETGNNRAGSPLLISDITKNIFLRVDKFNRSLRRIHRMYFSGSGGSSNPFFELGKQVMTTLLVTHLTNMFSAALQDMSSSPIMPILSGLAAGTGDAAGLASAATTAAGASANNRAGPLMGMIGGILNSIMSNMPPPQSSQPPSQKPKEEEMASNTRNRDSKQTSAPSATFNKEKGQYEVNRGDGLPSYTTTTQQ
jgi:hypothetical protein